MTITTRTSFAEWIAANPTPEQVVPARRVECERCFGSGEVVNGFSGYAPNQERCQACNGFGHVAPGCGICLDRGECAVGDAFGHHAYIEYCGCSAGRLVREADVINDAKAAHEDSMPDYLDHSHDRIDAGESPF